MRERQAHGMLHFYKNCLSHACRGRFRHVEKWTGSISLLGLVIIAFRSSLSAETQHVLQVDLPVYFFVSLFLITVVAGFVTAPYRLFAEEREKRLALEEQRRPKLEIRLPGTDPVGVALDGSTIETMSGRRQTVIRQWASSVFYLLCTNTGELPAKCCRARVLYASRDSAEVADRSGIIESIELAWSKKDPDSHLSADIAPGDTARIWLAYIRQNGSLWVFRNELPIHYQRVFGEAGHHKILLQIDGENIAPTQMLLSIHTEEATKPEGNGVWEPKAKAEILGQGGPVLEHPEMPIRVGENLVTIDQ
jgi:hypothetical protein